MTATHKIRSKVHPAQRQVLESAAETIAYVGGIGSGKTYAGALSILAQPPKTRILVIAPTLRMIKDGALEVFMEVGRDLVLTHNKAEMKTVLVDQKTILWRHGEPDKIRGANIGYLWIDEAASCTSELWDVALGRVRLSPGRILLTTTPKGLNWVYDEFGPNAPPGHLLINARTEDNPFTPAKYKAAVRRRYTDQWAQQELDGLFCDLSGGLFKRGWFGDPAPAPSGLSWFRFWDLAATANKTSDYSATCRLAAGRDGEVWIDIARFKEPWPSLKRRILAMAANEPGTPIGIESVAGFEVAFQEIASALPTHSVRSVKPSKTKIARALPVASRAEAGAVRLVAGPFTDDFLGEVALFPLGAHDDMIDAVSGAFAMHRTARPLKIVATRRGGISRGFQW